MQCEATATVSTNQHQRMPTSHQDRAHDATKACRNPADPVRMRAGTDAMDPSSRDDRTADIRQMASLCSHEGPIAREDVHEGRDARVQGCADVREGDEGC